MIPLQSQMCLDIGVKVEKVVRNVLCLDGTTCPMITRIVL